MTEALAEAVFDALTKKLGSRWRVVDGPDRNGGKRFRLEFVSGRFAMTFCRGDTRRQMLDDYVTACRQFAALLPEEVKANSAEELILKLAVSGELTVRPGENPGNFSA